ncbi:hypothetical protein ACFY4B_27430 [Kitasatospora sp. NPDC001261]|uniref:hypothetical protein n=1 Tax=Kitasatospora sp. NPDC001261 TaxID=3364012 RepID=UPI0036B9F8E1
MTVLTVQAPAVPAITCGWCGEDGHHAAHCEEVELECEHCEAKAGTANPETIDAADWHGIGAGNARFCSCLTSCPDCAEDLRGECEAYIDDCVNGMLYR